VARGENGGFSGATLPGVPGSAASSTRDGAPTLAPCRATFARVAPGSGGASPGRASAAARDVGGQGARPETGAPARAKWPFGSGNTAPVGRVTARDGEATGC